MSHDSMPTHPAEHRCDVLVIGGGPAGSTAATLLAEKGHRVTLLEKAHHPRFHIGESLLPANLPLFEQLGVRAEVEAIGMQKWGAEFISPWHEHRQTFEFADAWDKSMPLAYQVRRSEFDEILIRNAARKGANVIEGCRVRDVEFLPNDAGAIVRAEHDDGRSETCNAASSSTLPAATLPGNRFKATAQSKAQQRSPVRPFQGCPATRARWKATSASSGSNMAGSGSSARRRRHRSVGAVTWPAT
jgi:hypothetical protein